MHAEELHERWCHTSTLLCGGHIMTAFFSASLALHTYSMIEPANDVVLPAVPELSFASGSCDAAAESLQAGAGGQPGLELICDLVHCIDVFTCTRRSSHARTISLKAQSIAEPYSVDRISNSHQL